MLPDTQTISSFAEDLASSSPVPGGGGAAALVGALAAALASMVANLTAGKKKYVQYEDDIQRILKDAELLRTDLLACIEEDAKCFEPLSKAYGIPRDDPKRDEIMEEALLLACTAPVSIMELAANTLNLHRELAEKGSVIMLSDVGVGAACAKAALLSASLSIRINANMMKDIQRGEKLIKDAENTVREYSAIADEIYNKVLKKIG